MAIDPHYIPAFSIEDVILDKDTGAPLTGGLVYFEQDNQRGTLKPVYQITGTSPNYSYIQLPNPMTLSSIGTFVDSLGSPVIPYFYPYDANLDPEYYFVRVTSSGDVPQFTREAVPYIPASGGDSSVTSAFVNELSNPQFAEILFTSPITYDFTAASNEVREFAPGWSIVVSSAAAATVTLSIVPPTGALNRATNPGTMLQVNSTGVSSLRVRQRIYGSPNLWGSGYLSGTFVAKTYAGTSSIMRMLYSQSNGGVTDQEITSGTLTADGEYAAFPGSFLIPASDSVQSFPTAYVDIDLVIPLSTKVDITSVMVAATGSVSVDNIVYDQTTYARQLDQLFHYYKDSIIIRPKDSILTGWDFRLNPWQFYARALTTISSVGGYIADQTVLIAEVAASLQTSGSNTPAWDQAFVVKALNGVTQGRFALIQYIDPTTCRPALFETLSSLVKATIITSHGTQVGVKVKLLSSATTPATVNQVTGWDADGPIFNPAIWTPSLPLNNPTNILTSNVGANSADAFSYDKILSLTSSSTSQTLALVVYTTAAMNNTLGSEDYIAFQSISLVPNEFAIETNAKTFDQVLRECRYYYNKSFLITTLAQFSAGVNSGESYGVQGGGNTTANSTGPIIRFLDPMRAVPLVGLFNPVTANSLIYNLTISQDWVSTSAANITQNGFTTVGTTASSGSSVPGNLIGIHWVADARMGVV